jgi:hypothetical protein
MQELKCRVCDGGFEDGALRCPTCRFQLNSTEEVIGETAAEYEQRVQAARRAWQAEHRQPVMKSNNGAGAAAGVAPARAVVVPQPVKAEPAPKPAAVGAPQPAKLEFGKPAAQQTPVAASQVAKPVSLKEPLGHRMWAFAVGGAGCAIGHFAVAEAYRILAGAAGSHSIAPTTYAPVYTPPTTWGWWILFAIVPKLLNSIVAEKTRDIVGMMIWPWLGLTVLGLIFAGWDAWPTVEAVTFSIAALIGLCGVAGT